VPIIRYFAAARAAAGRSEESVPATTLDDLVSRVSADHGDRLATVLAASSFLVDGLAAHDRDVQLAAETTVDVLPPFAGG
jgi:molybdopterin converting factor small subunit